MEDLDAEGLALVLKNHLADNVIVMLKEQCVTGMCFMDLNPATLQLFNFPMGFILQITKLINAIKDGTKVLDLSSISNKNQIQSSSLSQAKSLEGTSSSNSSNFQQASLDQSPFNELDDTSRENIENNAGEGQFNENCTPTNNEDETDKILSEFLNENGIQTLSGYLKKSLRGIIERWKHLVAQNLPHSAAPNLCVDKKFLKNYSEISQSKPLSKRIGMEKADASRKSARLAAISNHEEESSCDDDSDSEKENGESNNNVVDSYNAPPLIKTQEELQLISPSLPAVFDVEKVLLEDRKTKQLVPVLKEWKLLGTKERKVVFRVLGRYLCYNYVDDPNKANAAMREGLAKTIVVTYPQLQKTITVPGKAPWSHIWSKSGGHLNNVIKRIQTSLPDEKRVRKGKIVKRKKKGVQVLACNVNIKELALLLPDKANKLEISDSMAKTYPQRCQAREKGISITELLADFPHLKSYHGEMIAAEFKRICPGAKDMCPEMVQYIPKILEKWDNETLELACNDDTLRAFMILASDLPHAIRQGTCTLPVEEELVVVTTPGRDLDEFVLERRLNARGPVQPYILALKGLVTSEILKYFLVLDGNILELGRIPFTRCFDWLFKSYTVFNVNYPASWTIFFRFLQTCFYQVFFSKEDDIPPSAMELYNKIKAL